MIASLFFIAILSKVSKIGKDFNSPVSWVLKIQYFEEIIYNYIQYFEEIIYIRLYEGIKFCTFSGNLFDD